MTEIKNREKAAVLGGDLGMKKAARKHALLAFAVLCIMLACSSCSGEAEELRLQFVREYAALTDRVAQCEAAGTLWEELDGSSGECGLLHEFAAEETGETIEELDEMLGELFLCSDQKSALLFYDRAMTELRTLQSYSRFSRPLSFDQLGDLYSVCSSVSMTNAAFHQILGEPVSAAE